MSDRRVVAPAHSRTDPKSASGRSLRFLLLLCTDDFFGAKKCLKKDTLGLQVRCRAEGPAVGRSSIAAGRVCAASQICFGGAPVFKLANLTSSYDTRRGRRWCFVASRVGARAIILQLRSVEHEKHDKPKKYVESLLCFLFFSSSSEPLRRILLNLHITYRVMLILIWLYLNPCNI